MLVVGGWSYCVVCGGVFLMLVVVGVVIASLVSLDVLDIFYFIGCFILFIHPTLHPLSPSQFPHPVPHQEREKSQEERGRVGGV